MAYFNTYHNTFLEVQRDITKYISQNGAGVEPGIPR
jgi:hypothetical protein